MKKIKQKILFYKAVLIEIMETLCSICQYLDFDGRHNRYLNPNAEYMRGHFKQLKQMSEFLRRELSEKGKKNDGSTGKNLF